MVTIEGEGLMESFSILPKLIVIALPFPDRDDMEMTVGISIAAVMSTPVTARLLSSKVGCRVPQALR